jgi:hypothetical protein
MPSTPCRPIPIPAPRLFALVKESDNPSDVRVVAWGLQFDDYVWVVGYNGQLAGSFSSADRALWLFSHEGARFVWCPRSDTDRSHRPRRRIIRYRR